MIHAVANERPWTRLGWWLVVAGAGGFFAAFALTLEKFSAYENPGAATSCDFNVIVQCSANLASAQGSLLGFPNPLIGVAAWPVVALMGMLVISGTTIPRWIWYAFNVGVVAATTLVVFLIGTSIFVLSTLCPYCMLTWAVTIPTFWAVSLRTVSLSGHGSWSRLATAASSWVPVISLLCFVAIALIAQLKLDVARFL